MKRVYGIKTSPRLWQKHLTSALENIGFKQSRADHCLFTSADIALLVYVDDLLIIGTSGATSDFLKKLEHQVSLKHVTQLTSNREI